MGVSSIEERKSTCCLSPKIYQPAGDMDGLVEFPRKKKMFASSSFYEEPNAVYPTIEEQVKLCRKIAESLSDDCNVKSKGANMFFKRVKRAEKWIVAESNGLKEEDSSEKDPLKMPYVRPSKDGPPRLKLILDPRGIIDMKRLLEEGVDIVKHDAMSPDVCHDIVKDLNSPSGKGAQLFAKRKKKSEEWIVDEEKVQKLLQQRYSGEYQFPEPSMPTLSLNVDSQKVAETVIRAAESKVMTYPNAVPHVPVIESLDGTKDWSKSQQQSDAYKFRAPKGWTTASPLPTIAENTTLPSKTTSQLEPTVSTSLPRYSPIVRSKSYSNFNSSPRAWNADLSNQFRPAAIKSVKPPSVLVQ